MTAAGHRMCGVVFGAALLGFAAVAAAADPAGPASAPKKGGTVTLGGTASDKGGGKGLTRDQLRQCMALDASVKSQNDEMTKAQAAINAEKADIARVQDELKDEQPKVDTTNADAIKAFNDKLTNNEQRVDAYNAKVPEFNAMGEKLNTTRATWQNDCAGRSYDEADFYAIKRGK